MPKTASIFNLFQFGMTEEKQSTRYWLRQCQPTVKQNRQFRLTAKVWHLRNWTFFKQNTLQGNFNAFHLFMLAFKNMQFEMHFAVCVYFQPQWLQLVCNSIKCYSPSSHFKTNHASPNWFLLRRQVPMNGTTFRQVTFEPFPPTLITLYFVLSSELHQMRNGYYSHFIDRELKSRLKIA